MNNKIYKVAVIGATGSVGHEVINNLHERKFPIESLIAAASTDSVGKKVSFGDEQVALIALDDINFAKIDIAFFCTNELISSKYAKKASDNGAIVIDKSSHFRLQDAIPLIVPEVNANLLKDFQTGIIASPNCCTIPLAAALKPLDNVSSIKRVVVSTYQSTSGLGKDGMDELYNQTKAKFVFEDLSPKVFNTQIAFNLIPAIGNLRPDGYSDEEYKIEQELKKILGDHVRPTITCVRVPVFVGHAMSVNIEFDNDITAAEAEEILYEADGITVYSLENDTQYTTPVDSVEYDDIFVSRIRDDLNTKNAINMWVCCDNLRKGAALNAVQIAEELINDC